MSTRAAVSRTIRALPTLFRVGFASAFAYRSEFLIWILSTNMPLVMLALWTEVAREAPVGGYGEKQFVAYFLAALIVRLLTGSWVLWELDTEIRQGQLAMRLLRPVHPFIMYASDNLAAVPIRAAIAVPIAIAGLAWAGSGTVHPTWQHLALAPVAIFGAWAITFGAMLSIGALGLLWDSAVAVFDAWLGLYFVLSGYLMPLEFFPGWLRNIASWLPFRFALAFPVELLLGTRSIETCLTELAAQWAWVIGFMLLALAIWKRGLLRYSVYGG